MKIDCPSITSTSSSEDNNGNGEDTLLSKEVDYNDSNISMIPVEAAMLVASILFLPFQNLLFMILTTIDIANTVLSFLLRSISDTGDQNGAANGLHKKKQQGNLPIDTFEIDSPDWTWDFLRTNYIKQGIPFILKPSNSSGPIASFSFPGFDEQTGQWDDTINSDGIMEVRTLPHSTRIPGIHNEIVKKLIPWSPHIVPAIVFAGKYGGSSCHLDIVPNGTNVYWMKRGCKDIVIVPPHVTRKTFCTVGEDALVVPGSADNHDYLQDLEAYYRFTLEEGQILVFNHAACLHHFSTANIKAKGDVPIGVSIRFMDFYYNKGGDPRCWLNNLFNPCVWWRLTKNSIRLVFFNQTVYRPQGGY